MEIKIGTVHNNRELSVNLDKADKVDDRVADLTEQLSANPVVTIAEASGRTIIVPSDRIAYIEVRPEPTRTVGFGDV